MRRASGIRPSAWSRPASRSRSANYTTDVPWNPQPFSKTANVHRVLEEFEAGATVVLQGLHYNWRPLAEFCRGLEAALGHPVQANAYYTPRGSQGLPVHHDTHDVFVLQVSGHKRWLVYNPVFELPLRDQRYKAELGAPGDPVHDLTLSAGDVLYLPRGWMHEALTSDADSLHITVGVNVYSWIDAVRAAVESCADDIEFRRSVPADGEPSIDLLERVRERLAADDVARRKRSRLVRSRRPILGGQLGQLRALDDLAADTELVRRPTVIAELDGAALVFEGKRVSFPAQAEEALAFAAPRMGPSVQSTCRATSMKRDGSCSCAAWCARASCSSTQHAMGDRDEPARTGRASRVAGQVGGLAERGFDLDLVHLAGHLEAHEPAVRRALGGNENHVVGRGRTGRLSHRPLRRLLRERVARAASIVLEGNPACEHLVQKSPGLRRSTRPK